MLIVTAIDGISLKLENHMLIVTTIDGISLKYSETCLNRTLNKPKTCPNQTDFTVLSTKP
jgi:hypothetical protein